MLAEQPTAAGAPGARTGAGDPNEGNLADRIRALQARASRVAPATTS
jgi:hypothetical protein